MKGRKIIAVLGLPGSGKSEVIKFLMKKCGWPKVYFGEPTFEELERLKLPVTEKNERMVRENLRKKYGVGYYGEQAIKKIGTIKGRKNIMLESFYTWAEYLMFKKKFKSDFITIAIYASPKTRYARLARRKKRPLAENEARSRDHTQIENLLQGGPIAMADHTIINENSKASLARQIDKIIKKLAKA